MPVCKSVTHSKRLLYASSSASSLSFLMDLSRLTRPALGLGLSSSDERLAALGRPGPLFLFRETVKNNPCHVCQPHTCHQELQPFPYHTRATSVTTIIIMENNKRVKHQHQFRHNNTLLLMD